MNLRSTLGMAAAAVLALGAATAEMRARSTLILGVLLLSVLAFRPTAQAVPFSFEYIDTISNTDIAGLSAGQAAQITVTLDNGGLTNLSQTWTASNLQSVTWDFNSGGFVTTFSAPFDGGLVFTTGDFETDAGGTLTSVMSSWTDSTVTANFTTTGSGTNFAWFLNGANAVYFESNSFVELTNVQSMLGPANWSPVSEIPEPSTMLLLGSGGPRTPGLAAAACDAHLRRRHYSTRICEPLVCTDERLFFCRCPRMSLYSGSRPMRSGTAAQ